MKILTSILYTVVSIFVIGFQLALAAGVPLGEYAMGGAYPGQFPPELRVAAVIQALILIGLAVVVLARANVALPRWYGASRRLIWLVVGFALLSLVLNLITPSAGERAIWAPIAFLLLASSGIVAFAKQ